MREYTSYKEEFFNYKQLNESVIKGYKMIFNKIAPLEDSLGKDLKSFTYEEILQALQLLKSKSFCSMITKWSLLKIYLESYGNENVQKVEKKDLEGCIQTIENANRFIKRQELYDRISKLKNPSDKAILLLLFEGIMGTAYGELLNLKIEQIDIEKGIIKIEDRTIILDDFGRNIIISAINQTEYLLDGSTENLNKKYYFNFNTKSPYLIKSKPSTLTNDGMNPLGLEGVKSKISKLLSLISLDHATGQSLFYSGLIEKILKYEMENNIELTLHEIKTFVGDLGIKKIQAQVLKEARNVYIRRYSIKN